jgi:hypothetical protein
MKPYETVQELLDDSKKHGPYVLRHNGPHYLITSIHKAPTCIGVVLGGYHKSPVHVKELLENYIWQDGSPCGKNEN